MSIQILRRKKYERVKQASVLCTASLVNRLPLVELVTLLPLLYLFLHFALFLCIALSVDNELV